MTRKDVKGDQPSGGETTWTNTGATRYGRGQHKTGSFGDDMLRPSPNHGTQRLPNDDDIASQSKLTSLLNNVSQCVVYSDSWLSVALPQLHLAVECCMVVST